MDFLGFKPMPSLVEEGHSVKVLGPSRDQRPRWAIGSYATPLKARGHALRFAALSIALSLGSTSLFPARGLAAGKDDEAVFIKDKVCRDIVITSLTPLALTATEKALICDKEPAQPWGLIPRWQKVYFVKRFLEARGYYKPQIKEEAERIAVEAGQLSLLREIKIEQSPIAIDPERYWLVYGKAFTSKALDQIESWVQEELGRHGYPCARLSTQAKPEQGLVTIRVEHATLNKFPRVKADLIPGLLGGIEQRYYAFATGDPYNRLLVDLSVNRLRRSEMVVSSNMSLQCQADGTLTALNQRHIPGEPRLIALGVGFDSDEYFIVEGSWKNTRIGSRASSLETYARASYRIQKAQVSFDWYYAPIIVRHFLRSSLSFTRENEIDYDGREVNAKIGPVWRYDRAGAAFDLWSSAHYSHYSVPRGHGPRGSRSLSFDHQLSVTSHDYEYYAQDPRSGYRMALGLNLAKKGVGSEFSANTYRVEANYLHNLFALEPAIWILGLRMKAVTTDIGKDTPADTIPSPRRHRLGGSQDLRGFERKTLPRQGALTALYLGAEARVNNTLPFGLQPIAFMDYGRLGPRGFTLTPTSYWSPGVGVHWQSPVGTIRASYAYGYTSEPGRDGVRGSGQWNISYGEQF